MKYSRYLLTALLLLSFTAADAQHRVKSRAYNAMLSKLLQHTVPEISVDSLQRCQRTVLLLDAREPEEYQVSHLPQAKYAGYNNFSPALLNGADKNSPVVVYCSVGYRSEKVAEKLRAAGFANVSNLYGGIFEWKNQGHTVVDATGAATEKVHAYSKLWGIWLQKGKKVYGTQ